MEPLGLVYFSFSRRRNIYHEIGYNVNLSGTENVFPGIPKNTPFLFKIIKPIWPYLYYELTKIEKTCKKLYEKNPADILGNDQQYRRKSYQNMFQSHYGLNPSPDLPNPLMTNEQQKNLQKHITISFDKIQKTTVVFRHNWE